MSKFIFGCTIKRGNVPPIAIDITLDSEIMARTLYSLFHEFLDEKDYGLILSQSREDVLQGKFTEVVQLKVKKPLTSIFSIALYKKDEKLCTLKPNTSMEQKALLILLSSYAGKQYTVVKRKR